jgi:hypothetical protein
LDGVVRLDTGTAETANPSGDLLVVKGEEFPNLERLVRLRLLRGADRDAPLEIPARGQPQQRNASFNNRMAGSTGYLTSGIVSPGLRSN